MHLWIKILCLYLLWIEITTQLTLQQNNVKFISFCFTWIPYNKNTAKFCSLEFFFWLIIIINTNMNTSFTINTALSKGLESITRHHSPLITDYISFQLIYKSYSERERNTKKEKEVEKPQKASSLNQTTLI